ncbi:MAG: transglutaminase-like domain-containing protein [Elusimicrobiota bacterium]
MAVKTLSETELRSLVDLLDDEDPLSFDLVRRQILDIGEPVLPFLEEMRAKSQPEVAAKVDAMTRALRFQNLKDAFLRLSVSRDPDLEKGALLITRFGYPGIDPAVYTRWLDKVATQVQDEAASSDPAVIFQHLNSHLFKAMGFSGNETRYYDPENSYLNRVIETRRGIPVSLSVLYLLLARRLKLQVHGVGTPGHFLVALAQDPEPCFVDTYNRGRIMNLADVRRMLARGGYEYRAEFTAPASSRDIIIRMMRNLISIYQKMGLTERSEMLSNLVEVMLTGRPAAPV